MMDEFIETLRDASVAAAKDYAKDYKDQSMSTHKDTSKQQILCALWTANMLLADIALSLRSRE